MEIVVDPRNPGPEDMVRDGSTHPAHDGLRKTIVLLAIEGREVPVYFVIVGTEDVKASLTELKKNARYLYEEHTCPTNFINVVLIAAAGDVDPHGIFRFIDAVWMTSEFEAYESGNQEAEYLEAVFPQITARGTNGKKSP